MSKQTSCYCVNSASPHSTAGAGLIFDDPLRLTRAKPWETAAVQQLLTMFLVAVIFESGLI